MSKKTPEQAIEDTIEAFRKNITKKYLTEARKKIN